MTTRKSERGERLMEHEKDKSVRTACRGLVPLTQAAYILRLSIRDVEEAISTGDLPCIEHQGVVYLDGPRLLAGFATPASETHC